MACLTVTNKIVLVGLCPIKSSRKTMLNDDIERKRKAIDANCHQAA